MGERKSTLAFSINLPNSQFQINKNYVYVSDHLKNYK